MIIGVCPTNSVASIIATQRHRDSEANGDGSISSSQQGISNNQVNDNGNDLTATTTAMFLGVAVTWKLGVSCWLLDIDPSPPPFSVSLAVGVAVNKKRFAVL